MKTPLNIKSYCTIKDNTISLNGKIYFSETEDTSFQAFSKKAYQVLGIKYPKFFKMDNLSKLALLSSELLAEKFSTNKNTAIVLSNRSASLATDRKHQKSISDKENYYPSPAIFVYTLPNITIGEISIKHKIKGENAFFVSDIFNAKLLMQYATSLIKNNKCTEVLCGWVDFDNEQYNAFMYLVALEGSYQHTEKFINTLYNN